MADTAVANKETTKHKLKEPKRFKVILLNDDFTPMEFVVALLCAVFRHSEKSAYKLMMQIHTNGSAVAGVYPYEIAEQKGLEATNLAREHGHPLQIKIQPE